MEHDRVDLFRDLQIAGTICAARQRYLGLLRVPEWRVRAIRYDTSRVWLLGEGKPNRIIDSSDCTTATGASTRAPNGAATATTDAQLTGRRLDESTHDVDFELERIERGDYVQSPGLDKLELHLALCR